jgi:hypothetical protein
VSSTRRNSADGGHQAQQAQLTLGEAILGIVSGNTLLVGAPRSLARGFHVTVATLRATLRELLERGEVAVQLDALGRLTIRPGRLGGALPAPTPRTSTRRTSAPLAPAPLVARLEGQGSRLMVPREASSAKPQDLARRPHEA